jgi:methylated-DNA-[protein]-cysteine S-methyltransferase
MKTRRPTEFEMAVYDAVRLIPAGKVASYGRISLEISRGNARAVGSALAKNPFAPEVPCHRVVCADGSLGGFYGATKGPRMEEKSQLLRREGVPFLADGKVDCSAFTG